HLLLIGTYRDAEVDRAHLLTARLATIEKTRPPLRLHLAPLAPNALEQLIADTLHDTPDAIRPLAGLIQHKTEGNPFFVGQFLRMLHQEGLIVFNRNEARWCWDMAHIRETKITDNVVELMTRQISQLPLPAQTALKLAACLGNTFALDDMALI